MALIRCQQGHFYDPARHNVCPYCGSMPAGAVGATEAQSPMGSPPLAGAPSPVGATRPMRDTPPPVVGPTVPLRPAGSPPVGAKKGSEEGKTIAVDMKK